MPLAPEIQDKLRAAVRQFWLVRRAQAQKQASGLGGRDAGERAAVTGGQQMDGFVTLVREVLCEQGVQPASVHCERRLELPGWYRPEKKWDLIVVTSGDLLAGIEFKSQVGPSFGNSYNNRTEEALGSATDLWAAYREGAFAPSGRPWLGYLMLLEDCDGSNAPVRAREPHYRVFEEFREASYAKRYEILLTKMVRAGLYDAACLLLARGETERFGVPGTRAGAGVRQVLVVAAGEGHRNWAGFGAGVNDMRPGLRAAGVALAVMVILGLAGCGHRGAAAAVPWHLTLSTDPNPPEFLNNTTFKVQVTDSDGRAVNGATVTVDLTMATMDMGPNQVALHEQSAGLYTGTGSFTMAGSWQCKVTASAAGHTETVTFPITAKPLP